MNSFCPQRSSLCVAVKMIHTLDILLCCVLLLVIQVKALRLVITSLCANYKLQVQTDYELAVQVLRYVNPSHRGLSIPDGQCCDGACTNDCDNRLTLCLRPQGTTDPDPTQCSVGGPQYTTTTTGTSTPFHRRYMASVLSHPSSGITAPIVTCSLVSFVHVGLCTAFYCRGGSGQWRY